jgi:hypothetical protein
MYLHRSKPHSSENAFGGWQSLNPFGQSLRDPRSNEAIPCLWTSVVHHFLRDSGWRSIEFDSPVLG